MAQQQSVLGIFGLSPEMYAQRRQDELEAEQMAVGKMSSGPGSLLNPSMANIYGLATQQGQMIGQGVRGLLGVEDPQMQMVRDVTQMRTQFDVSTPAGLRSFAQALGQKGYTDLAIQATARAADVDKDIALAQKARRESTPAAEETAKRIRLNELVQQFGDVEGARRFNQEQLEGRQSVAKAGAPPGQKQIFEVEKDRAKKIQKELDSGYTVLERLNEQASAIKNGVIGGSFADTRTALATLGATLGIADPKLINALSNTRSFKANELALGAAIAKQLGVNPTDKDFTASLDQFARNSDDPRAALLFIEQLQDKFGKRVKINEDMMNVYLDPETGGSFRNYKGPKMIEPFTSSNELERLLAEKNKRTNKQK
jgi:hypothetical protein